MATEPNPLKRLSVMAGKKGLTDLHIPTITEDAQDVVGKLHNKEKIRNIFFFYYFTNLINRNARYTSTTSLLAFRY